jgi:outer membrane protein assembly factor BamB
MTESGRILNAAEVDFLLDSAADDAKLAATEPAGDAQAVTMRGDLEQINLSDIFQTLGMTKMEGVLMVRNPLEQRQVYCHDGFVRILVPPRTAVRRLGQRLVQAGLVQHDQLRAALVAQRKHGKPLGQLLVAEGLVTQEQIDELAGMQVGEDLFSLFTWRHGTFEFYKGEVQDQGLRERFDLCPEFEVSSLLLEVARRSDEWESILAAIGSLEEIPCRIGDPDPAVEATYGDGHRTMLYGADGQTTWRALAEQSTLGLFEVSRAARDLVKQGVLRNIGDAELVAVAQAAATATHHKQAIVLLQTLNDRAGERSLDLVRAAAKVLHTAGEKRLAGQQLLEAAQHQTEGALALELAREARTLAPDDAATLSFLRTTLLVHAPSDSEELEQVTLALLDALLEDDLPETVLEIVANARETGTVKAAFLMREARARQKAKDVPGAVNTLLELVAIHRERKDRQRTIETYEAILRLDRSRRDVQKQLSLLRQTRLGRCVRVVATLLCVGMVGASAAVWWQQSRFDQAVQRATSEVGDLLAAGDRGNARLRLHHWVDVLGDCEGTEDLRRQVDFAEATERGRLQREERKQINGRLIAAAEAFAAGRVLAAIDVYAEIHAQSAYREEAEEVLVTRLQARLADLDLAAKAMANRLPEPPSPLLARRELAAVAADLDSVCPPALRQSMRDLVVLAGKAEWPACLPTAMRAPASQVVQQGEALFTRADVLATAYADALQRSENERRLDPMFKAAVQREQAHDFAGALEFYRQLEREPAGNSELRAHFRSQIERNEAIVGLLKDTERATAAGEFAKAQECYRALRTRFAELPFDRLVRLPLRVESLPAGAAVRAGDTDLGRTPCLVSYVPGATTELALALDGFVATTTAITGDETGLWHTRLARQPLLERKLDHLVEAAPVVDGDGVVYTVDRGGTVTAFERGSGRDRWRFRSGDLSGLLSQPLLHDDVVLVASLDGELRALSRAAGELVWSLPDLPVEVLPIAVGRQLVLATTRRELHAIDLDDRSRVSVSLPEPVGDGVLATGRHVVTLGTGGTVQAHALPALTEAWRHRLRATAHAAAALTHDSVHVVDDGGRVTCLDLATGAVRWHRELDRPALGPGAIAGGRLWITTPSDVVALDLADGEPRLQIASPGTPWSAPVLAAGERLLVADRDGDVHVHDSTGAPRYRLGGARRGVRTFLLGDSVGLALGDRRLVLFAPLP